MITIETSYWIYLFFKIIFSSIVTMLVIGLKKTKKQRSEDFSLYLTLEIIGLAVIVVFVGLINIIPETPLGLIAIFLSVYLTKELVT